MKCQHCEKPATFHITERIGSSDEWQELHLCEDHARQYLAPTTEQTSIAGTLAQQLKVGQTAEELAKLDQRSCPFCGITFYEFRHQGRLGCPHDYVCFQEELEPLIVSIHGETKHTGKRSMHGAGAADRQTELIRLRREMKEAVEKEQYERASEMRDEIRRIEQEGKT